ncbi:alcohol dehydogenase [Trametopsis cervina]|nr:alcohol dehydogenase [Trametopsis cervina]
MASQLPTDMTAYYYKPSIPSPVAERIPLSPPADNEVLIKVLAAGVCHSDVGIFDIGSHVNRALSSLGSWICGHEGAGEIVALGSSVPVSHPSLTVGTYIAVYGPNSCFEQGCIYCGSGNEGICRKNKGHGLGDSGAWAEYMFVRAECAVPVPGTPQTISPAIVAISTDAILTPYHAMKHACNIQPGQTVLIYGVGGLGLHAVAIGKSMLGAKVVACDLRQTSLEQAKDLGADYIATPDKLLACISENKLSIDVAIDIVGAQSTFEACFAAIRPGGTIHHTGLASPEITITPVVAMVKNLTYKTSYWGCKSELAEILQAIADGKLTTLVQERRMSELPQLLHDMHEGKIKSRVAVIPDSLFPGSL